MHKPASTLRTDLTMSFLVAGVVIAGLAPIPFTTAVLQARVIDRTPVTGTWQTLSTQQVESGATIPAGRHIFFHVPAHVQTITREVLLGQRGSLVRYWGYCFPEADDPENPPQSAGFPGKIFLSEAERSVRTAQENRQRAFSPFQRPPTIPEPRAAQNRVRHQLETFRGGMTCYIMTAKELPIGTDADGDTLNTQREKQALTNPSVRDTDADGIDDGDEVSYRTNPKRRDSDGDGLIDGIEDANRNGRLDGGETDPRKLDSDGDALCDGYCHDFKIRRMCRDNKGFECTDIPYGQPMGEDKNLNGKVDKGESDPRNPDTLGDGIRDDARFYKCLLDGRRDC